MVASEKGIREWGKKRVKESYLYFEKYSFHFLRERSGGQGTRENPM